MLKDTVLDISNKILLTAGLLVPFGRVSIRKTILPSVPLPSTSVSVAFIKWERKLAFLSISGYVCSRQHLIAPMFCHGYWGVGIFFSLLFIESAIIILYDSVFLDPKIILNHLCLTYVHYAV